MQIVPGLGPRDFPPPPTIDEIARRFAAPLFTFVPQPSLREAGWGVSGQDEVSLSYSVFRHPDDIEHPANFRDDSEVILQALRKAEADKQPQWFIDGVAWMRFPVLWEAVRTVRLGFGPDRPLAQRLAEHVNHVLTNGFEARRRDGVGGPPSLDHGVTAGHAQAGVTLEIDGTDVDAIIIDTDPDVVGWAAQVDDFAVLVAVDRDFLPMVDLRLVRRSLGD